jgi:hypothetical protein
MAETSSSSFTRGARECGAARLRDRPCHHQRIGAGLNQLASVVRPDTAVDFDQARRITPIDEGARLANLFDRSGNELLTREAGVDAHDEHRVAILDHVLQQLDRRLGADRETRLRAYLPQMH